MNILIQAKMTTARYTSDDQLMFRHAAHDDDISLVISQFTLR